MNPQRFFAGLALVVVFLVAMWSCASTIDQETRAAMTPAHTLYEIQATYNAALAGALVYAEQDRCTELVVVACHDAQVVAELAALDTKITAALPRPAPSMVPATRPPPRPACAFCSRAFNPSS